MLIDILLMREENYKPSTSQNYRNIIFSYIDTTLEGENMDATLDTILHNAAFSLEHDLIIIPEDNGLFKTSFYSEDGGWDLREDLHDEEEIRKVIEDGPYHPLTFAPFAPRWEYRLSLPKWNVFQLWMKQAYPKIIATVPEHERRELHTITEYLEEYHTLQQTAFFAWDLARPKKYRQNLLFQAGHDFRDLINAYTDTFEDTH